MKLRRGRNILPRKRLSRAAKRAVRRTTTNAFYIQGLRTGWDVARHTDLHGGNPFSGIGPFPAEDEPYVNGFYEGVARFRRGENWDGARRGES